MDLQKSYIIVKGFSRYEHSLGVAIILDKLGADTNTLIAGLLHDIAHTAFSHVHDFIYKRYNDDYHDHIFLDVLEKNKELTNILNEYGYDYNNYYPMESNFNLVKSSNNYNSTDRYDYTLREYKLTFPNSDMYRIINSTKIVNNKLVFNDIKTARKFAEMYMYLSSNHWGSSENITRYGIFARMLRIALKKDIIKDEDFYQHDEYIMNKIYDSKAKELLNLIEKLKTGNFEKEVHPKKIRYVNPHYLDSNNNLKTLLQEDKNYKRLVNNYIEKREKYLSS